MSFWDKYLAPGDLRHRQQALQAKQAEAERRATESASSALQKQPSPRIRVDAATRARRQNSVLAGGIVFSVLSVLVSRRAVARKIGPKPTTFNPSSATMPGASTSSVLAPGAPIGNAQGGLDAAEALSYATLNVLSFGLLGAGVYLKVCDIADIEDMRDQVRRGVGFDVYGGSAEADKELETWVAELLSSKEGLSGLREGVAEKLAEIDRREQEKARQALAKR